MLVLCMSTQAFGSDWAQLEACGCGRWRRAGACRTADAPSPATFNGVVRIWNLAAFVAATKARKGPVAHLPIPLDQVQYTNAKVLLVGDSGVGKTGLANRLALGRFEETDSTDGAWATHWPLQHRRKKAGVEREIWLWDFAGQVDLNAKARQECRAGRQSVCATKSLLQQFEIDLFHRAKTSSSVNGARWFHRRPLAIFQHVCAARK